MALWNQRDLIPPALMNEMVKSKEIKAQISALTITCAKMVDYFSSLNNFERAAAYLSRYCHRYKLRLRNMHGFQLMRRINQTLLRIKSVNISWDIINFHGSLPNGSYIETEVSLPVRSQLEYLLVRLQGLAKLLIRVVSLTKETTRYKLKLISEGFLYFTNSMFIASMGELWQLTRDMCRRLVIFYGELQPALAILPESEEYWLPEDYELPTSLAKWLGEEFKKEIVGCVNKDAVLDLCEDPSIFTILKHDEDDFVPQMNDVANVTKEPDRVEPSISAIPKTMLRSMHSDTGVLVTSRPSAGKKSAFDPAKLNHIRSKFHVKQFIAEEHAKRTENLRLAVSGKVSESQFGDFNVRLMKQFNRLTSADFTSFFKKEFVKLVCVSTNKN